MCTLNEMFSALAWAEHSVGFSLHQDSVCSWYRLWSISLSIPAFLVCLTKLGFISTIYLLNIHHTFDWGVFLIFIETLNGAEIHVCGVRWIISLSPGLHKGKGCFHPFKGPRWEYTLFTFMQNTFASATLFCLFIMNAYICFGFFPITSYWKFLS